MRTQENQQPAEVNIKNPNFNEPNSISQIEVRDVWGISREGKKKKFGKFYFVINQQEQTELLIRLEDTPLKVSQVQGKESVRIPKELRVDMAFLTTDSDGYNDYNYRNLSPEPEENLATISFSEVENDTRDAEFSAVINRTLGGGQKNKPVQRIVLRSQEEDPQNVYIDRDKDLPVKVRGNEDLGISGQPAPFFWVKL
jgi:hypothetical protein